MRAIARVEWRCTHRGASRRRHGEALAVLRARVGAGGAGPAGPAPLVLVHCGERPAGKDAPLGCEVVRVRGLDVRDREPSLERQERHSPLPRASGGEGQGEGARGTAVLDQAAALVLGAIRFAEETGDLRGPRRGPLAALGRPPIEIAAACPGVARCGVCIGACAAGALRAGTDGRPTGRGDACTWCGECLRRCPLGAMGFAHAPWPALNARLEALLGGACRDPVAIVLFEAPGPTAPDDARETAQPDDPRILPMELPPGALGTGVVLRALELGAAAVCAVVPRPDAPCAAGIEAAIGVAHAAGQDDRVVRAASLGEALARLRRPLPPPDPPGGPIAREPARRPDGGAIALSLWCRARRDAPLRLSGPGSPGGAAILDGAACTLCGLCAEACPTGALARRAGATVALELDSSRCPGPCGRCEAACPDRALAIVPELRLPPGRATLVARAGTCPTCGEIWLGAAGLPALGPKLGAAGGPALVSFLSMCPPCRSRALGASMAQTAGPPSLRAADRDAAGVTGRPASAGAMAARAVGRRERERSARCHASVPAGLAR